MARYKFTPKEIYETDFDTKMRGYDKNQVDEMLDNVISDYETYAAELLKYQEENEFLKGKVAELEAKVKNAGTSGSTGNSVQDLDQTQRYDPFAQTSSLSVNKPVTSRTAPIPNIGVKEPSNYDLLKRINRLERAVFGPGSSFTGDTTDLK